MPSVVDDEHVVAPAFELLEIHAERPRSDWVDAADEVPLPVEGDRATEGELARVPQPCERRDLE